MKNELLEVKKLSREFRSGIYFGTSFKAVEDVSFIMKGDKPKIVTICGESGCGKTTLSNMLLGFLKPTEGVIKYKNRNILTLKKKEKKWFKHEVQPIFQNPYESFNPFNRVDYYLLESCLNFNKTMSREKALKIIHEILNKIGINPKNVFGKYPHEFSGGQLQRLSIGRALISKPSLLIADEPVSMIDATLQIGILNLLADLNKNFNLSIIYVTHSLSTAYYLSSRVEGEIIIMYRGNIVEHGKTEKVLTKPLHPYTKLLIESIPPLVPNKKWCTNLNPLVLELEEFTLKGCKFVKRCSYSKDICFREMPPLKYIEDRLVRCWLY